jgi:hypothetical protein
MDRVEREKRLIDAVKGVCGGLTLLPTEVQKILDYVEQGWLPASIHSADECRKAFEWLRMTATQDDAPEEAGVALDEWAALSASVRPANPF